MLEDFFHERLFLMNDIIRIDPGHLVHIKGLIPSGRDRFFVSAAPSFCEIPSDSVFASKYKVSDRLTVFSREGHDLRCFSAHST